MKRLFTFLAISTSLISLAQGGHELCSRLKSHQQFERSNILSLEDIQKTEQYDVHHYFLDLNMSNENTDVSGTVEIHARTIEAITEFVFELHSNFTITNLTIDGNTAPFYRNTSGVYVPVNMQTDSSFICAITYNGTAPDQSSNPLGGGGLTSDSSPSWGNQITWSLSEPFSAFEWFPCKQALNDKIDSTLIHVTVDTNLMVGSNGLLVDDVDLGNGKHRLEWKSNYPVVYYLISVAIGEYVQHNFYANPAGAPNPILVQNFIYNNPATLANFQDDIDETASFIEYFSEIYGLYPFHEEKYGHCMAPLSGGMEHQTMTTQGWFEKTLTAHELGHQWFGNYTTCRSWADLWLNEGFATYSEYLMLEELYPGEEIAEMDNVHANVMSQNGGSVYIEDSLNTGRLFNGRLTYNKGSAILHTLRYLVNDDDLFFQILRTYLQNNAFESAVANDFFSVAENLSGLDLTNYKNEWYYEEGFPTYFGSWNQIGNELVVNLQQTTSSSTPLFTNDVDILINRSGMADTIVRLQVNANSIWSTIELNGTVTGISIDPNNWIINQSNGMTNNSSITSIEDVVNFETIVYPNPTNEEFTIVSEKEFSNIQLISAEGKIVYQSISSGTKNNVNVSHLSAGFYTLLITHQEGLVRKKIRVL